MKAAEQLQAAKNEYLRKLKPPFSNVEMSTRLATLRISLPSDVRKILSITSGFNDSPFGEVNFLPRNPFGFAQLIPLGLPVAADECGNTWVIDVNVKTGEWGAVLFVSHDPPVMAIQADSIDSFVQQILSIGKSAVALTEVAIGKIWHEDPFLQGVESAAQGSDPVLRRFAELVPRDFKIADLRAKQPGTGFSWGKRGPETKVRRFESELLFAIPS